VGAIDRRHRTDRTFSVRAGFEGSSPLSRAKETSIRTPSSTSTRDHARRTWHRRGVLLALVFAGILHAIAIAFLSIPGGSSDTDHGPLVLVPQAIRIETPPDEPAFLELRGAETPAERESATPTAAPLPETDPTPEPPDEVPIRTPVAGDPVARPVEETIPPTALLAMRSAPLPLVATETGIARRTVDPDPRRLVRARAESILSARFETPVAESSPTAGPATLSRDGGVTISVPWGGFVREDRKEDVWRSERCEKESSGDKPGEAEAKSAQCE